MSSACEKAFCPNFRWNHQACPVSDSTHEGYDRIIECQQVVAHQMSFPRWKSRTPRPTKTDVAASNARKKNP